MGGKMSRTKGHNFERRIASELRELWPGADVHRSSQADRARESDVVIDGAAPEIARALWLELQDARDPNPNGKLAQAEFDIAKLAEPRTERVPVVVWHRIQERRTQVSMRFAELVKIVDRATVVEDPTITLDWEAFKRILGALQGETT